MTAAFYFILQISYVVEITSFLQLIGVAQNRHAPLQRTGIVLLLLHAIMYCFWF